jgi:hypothetical protein
MSLSILKDLLSDAEKWEKREERKKIFFGKLKRLFLPFLSKEKQCDMVGCVYTWEDNPQQPACKGLARIEVCYFCGKDILTWFTEWREKNG